MNGEYRHMLDSKGRVFIPSRIREEIGDVVYITISSERCLYVYSQDSWNDISAKVNSLPFNKQNKFRPLFSYAVRCEIDSQGRVLIPSNLRNWADLFKEVFIIGNNNHAEIWDSDVWENMNRPFYKPELLLSTMEEFNF